MAVRPVITWPDPMLTTPTREVSGVDDALRALFVDLFDTMAAEDGIGLAANQVGEPLRVMVLDLDPHRRAAIDAAWQQELEEMGWRAPLVVVNPRIEAKAGRISWEEGCLSVPDITAEVVRAREVTLSALDAEGQPQRYQARGLFAVAIQHEVDHLDGKVFIDRLSRLKREIFRKRLMQAKAGGQSSPAPRRRPPP